MTGHWITDIRHFLDEQGRVPDDLPAVPRYMGAIVAAASALPTGTVFALDIHCRLASRIVWLGRNYRKDLALTLAEIRARGAFRKSCAPTELNRGA